MTGGDADFPRPVRDAAASIAGWYGLDLGAECDGSVLLEDLQILYEEGRRAALLSVESELAKAYDSGHAEGRRVGRIEGAAEEREACARLADDYAPSTEEESARQAGWALAEAIRARGGKP